MDLTLVIATVVLIWSVAVVTPGANFLIIVHTAVEQSRHSALIVVLGICTGTIFWALAGFVGIDILFQSAPWLYIGMKALGGAYLVYLGVKLLRSSKKAKASKNLVRIETGNNARYFRLGLLTNLSNPKTAAFSASLFAATLPADPDTMTGLVCVTLMTLISLLWYSTVAFVFSTESFRLAYHHRKHCIERIAGTVFVLLGARLAFN